ncbi:MAG TPA: hypothetical protein ENH29_10240 [Bacteroidetes bacterium]|nr:hypothetical protein [Bacteroidota bacterium]
MDVTPYRREMIERFYKYVGYDTQSSEISDTYPSTEKQKILGRILADDLRAIGLEDVQIDQFSYVTAALPSNSAKRVKTHRSHRPSGHLTGCHQ